MVQGEGPRIKQVILIRKDLGMRRGKEIAQGSHASMEFLVSAARAELASGALNFSVQLAEDERRWLAGGTAKVCLRVDSEAELILRHERAISGGLKSFLILDSGRTEFRGEKTLTACAIGPAPADQIDQITGDLVPY